MDQLTLLESAERHLPGACLGMMSLPPDLRMVMVRGQGSKVYDAAGKEYVDYMLGSGPLLLGHAGPKSSRPCSASPAGSTYFALNEPAIRLAEALVEAVPCGEAVRFQTTGSEATFAALRLARAFTGRDKVLKFEGGWHGGHDLGQLSGAAGGAPLSRSRSRLRRHSNRRLSGRAGGPFQRSGTRRRSSISMLGSWRP